MRYFRRLIRPFSVFFTINILLTLFTPTQVFALTSGPNMPEYTSFEPVDTTDMVNLATGDFTYNLPLIEVPGPEGGYPMSLSYHGGISPNEDASWAGLGWTLNPGAINRVVNGYADDQFDVVRTVQDKWSGGSRNTFSLGVGYSGASLKLSLSRDTNKGVGLGGSMGVGFGGFAHAGLSANPYGEGSDLSVGVNVGSLSAGYSMRGGWNAGIKAGPISMGIDKNGPSAMIGIGTQKASVGIATDFKSVSGFADVKIGPVSGSIATSKGKTSLSLNGFSSYQNNSHIGRMSTEGSGWEIPLIIYPITIGYDYLRYWSDESSNVKVIGSLHAEETSGKDIDQYGFDSYIMPTPEDGFVADDDPEKAALTGSFPAADFYNVTGQGIAGNIQPYQFYNGSTFRQNVKDGDDNYVVKFNRRTSFGQTGFRFQNDFSNARVLHDQSMQVNTSQPNGSINFGGTITGTAVEGESFIAGKLAGSKHVAFFTNAQIAEGFARGEGFIDYTTATRPAVRTFSAGQASYNVANQIGGFSITNESGVTYHYALPVYSFGEFSRSNKADDDANTYHMEKNFQAYAYTWLLTAITGADFVDSSSDGNPNGVLDENDWGYYVKFDYGMWADSYYWRNPFTGKHSDIDNRFQFYSFGAKELYYLNSVSTRTHTALFIKEIRNDAKGVSTADGGSEPLHRSIDYQYNCPDNQGPNTNCQTATYYYDEPPVSSLKLKSIYLLKNEDVPAGLASLSNDTYYSIPVNHTLPPPATNEEGATILVRKHYDKNVIDVFDLSALSGNLRDKTIKSIDLQTSYTLCGGVPNSFDLQSPAVKTGKLTLDAVKTYGKAGVSVLPPLRYYYDKNPAYNAEAYDVWDNYKSDYNPAMREGLKRLVTPASAPNTDAWSLTRIKTQLGNTIAVEYESDTYLSATKYRGGLYLDQMTRHSTPGQLKVTFVDNTVRGIVHPEAEMQLLGMLRFWGNLSGGPLNFCEAGNGREDNATLWEILDQMVTVKEVHPDYLIVANQYLYDRLEYIPGSRCVKCDGSAIFINGATGGCAPYNFAYVPTFIGGNLFFEGTIENYGGGSRVKSIEVRNFNSTSITNYGYTYGVTSYEPIGLEDPIGHLPELNRDWLKSSQDKAIKLYTEKLQEKFSPILSMSRFLPAPGVIYGMVTMTEAVTDAYGTTVAIPGRKVYQFETFKEQHVGRTLMTTNDTNAPSRTVTPLVIDDYTAWIGTLKSYQVYGPDNALIESSSFKYLHDGKTGAEFSAALASQFSEQGIISQVFNEHREVRKDDGGMVTYNTLSQLNQYPLVPTGQTAFNNKTGITTNSFNLAFDFYSGNPTKVRTTDGYGNQFVTVTTPAYRVGSNSGMNTSTLYFKGMGIKVAHSTNRNMLTQNAMTYTYKENGPVPGLVSASAQVWENDVPILGQSSKGQWQIKYDYKWAGRQQPLLADGLYPYASFHELDFDDLGAYPEWERQGELTLYDKYSHSLEARDMGGIYASTKFSSDEKFVVASASNVKYNEFVYASAEDPLVNGNFGGGILKEDGTVVNRTPPDPNSNEPDNSTITHTGLRAVSLTTSGRTLVYSFPSRGNTYKASVWTNSPNGRLKYKVGTGSEQTASLTPVRKAGNWYLLETNIPAPVAGQTVLVWCAQTGGGATFDDYRVHAVNGGMTSYVYNQWGELSHMLDNNNTYTEYRYDATGKLRATFRESFLYNNVKVSEQQYHFANTKN